MNYANLLSPSGYAAGGIADIGGRHIRGAGDGMSDSVPAVIDGERPAALGVGEYVVTADVVSFLGNGDNGAGAKVLDQMMARIRYAKTGRTMQPPRIDPRKFLPA